MCCGGVREPETLKMVSSEMLLAELKTRRESTTKQRGEYFKKHWPWSKFSYVCMLTLGGIAFLGILAGALGLQIMQESIIKISMGVLGFTVSAIAVLILFKDKHVSAQFEKEFPEEYKLLSNI